MAKYRAVRSEDRVAVGGWTGDFHKGDVVETGDPNSGFIPQSVADYLEYRGLFVAVSDDASDNPWFDSEDPNLSGAG